LKNLGGYCRVQRARDKTVLRAACLAHIRRKFENARAERPEVIDWILRIIARLYMIEKPLREYKVDAAVRLRVRQNRSRPPMNLLGKAFKRLITTRIRPKSGLGQALQYALGQWPAMQTFLEDGRVEIDNNDTENDIRPSAVGKKNCFLHDKSLRRSCAGKRVALLGHPASVSYLRDSKFGFEHSMDALIALAKDTGEFKVTAAFGPQHGMRGELQDNMQETHTYTDPVWQVPVYSLYGDVRRPNC
jgi:hypothetical protein